ncbi:MAG: PorP/SprF family type IX secretion system membrane protein [Phaeodactylibacter sp.]|uniref:PorP/SprF family type IX secretion system membrane protein n=1 Tax=Phaeodactylibacter sp. TaxID=1940289 RepID=UPI0032F0876E
MGRKTHLLVLLIGMSIALPAQDLHFSQFHNAPQQLNPALVGAYRADHRLGANYRSQWQSVPVAYETISAGYSRKMTLPKLKTHRFGVGAHFLYDQAGDGQLSWVQVSLSLAYHLRLSDEQTLSAGVQARMGQRTLQPGAFQFGDQFTDNFFDPQTASAEVFARTASGYSSLGAGLNWRYADPRSRTEILIGAGSAHLNQPTLSFLENEAVPLPILLNLHATALVELNDVWDLSVYLLGQRQGSYREIVGLAGGRYHLNELTGWPLAVQLSGGYRLSDAAIVMLELYYRDWRLGLSYDINTSPFRQATNGRGGTELSLQYFITEVKPPKAFKACPVF